MGAGAGAGGVGAANADYLDMAMSLFLLHLSHTYAENGALEES